MSNFTSWVAELSTWRKKLQLFWMQLTSRKS